MSYDLTSLNAASSPPSYTDSTHDGSVYVGLSVTGPSISGGTVSMASDGSSIFGELDDCQSGCGGAPYLQAFVNDGGNNYASLYFYFPVALPTGDLSSQADIDSYAAALGAGTCSGGLPDSNGCFYAGQDAFTFNTTPEPGSMGLFLTGGLGLLIPAFRRRLLNFRVLAQLQR